MVLVKECVEQHPQVKLLQVHFTGSVTPQRMGIETQTLQFTTHTSLDGESLSYAFAPGW